MTFQLQCIKFELKNRQKKDFNQFKFYVVAEMYFYKYRK